MHNFSDFRFRDSLARIQTYSSWIIIAIGLYHDPLLYWVAHATVLTNRKNIGLKKTRVEQLGHTIDSVRRKCAFLWHYPMLTFSLTQATSPSPCVRPILTSPPLDANNAPRARLSLFCEIKDTSRNIHFSMDADNYVMQTAVTYQTREFNFLIIFSIIYWSILSIHIQFQICIHLFISSTLY